MDDRLNKDAFSTTVRIFFERYELMFAFGKIERVGEEMVMAFFKVLFP
jgi:hypothetical protein